MTDILFVAISLVAAVPLEYCFYKIEENRFTNKKLTKYWVGLWLLFLTVIGVSITWTFVATGGIKQ